MESLNRIIQTDDGSHSLLRVDLNETYHSTKGALQESQYVYIQCGLDALSLSLKPIYLFEMGIGTGLNALLAYKWATTHNRPLVYYGVDTTIVPYETISQLNYGDRLNLSAEFEHFHLSEWNKAHVLSPCFSFKKMEASIEDLDFDTSFDCIFYDAFAPKYQPNVWHPNILTKVYQQLNPNGVFITYCCSGNVVRFFRQHSTHTSKLPGPPGKREILQVIRTGCSQI